MLSLLLVCVPFTVGMLVANAHGVRALLVGGSVLQLPLMADIPVPTSVELHTVPTKE